MKKEQVARVLPQSYEAEQATLGCALISQNASSVIISTLKADDFYFDSHKIIFQTMFDIAQRTTPIDFVTTVSELTKTNQLEKVGGVEYLTTLTNIVPSASNFEHYSEIVLKNSVLRQLIYSSQDIIENSFLATNKTDAMQYAEKKIFDIGQSQEFSQLTPMSKEIDAIMEYLNKIDSDKDFLKGLKTDFYALDKLTNGLQRSDLILLAARPSVGKTSFALNIALNASINHGAKVAMFSLEMPKSQLVQRAIFSTALVSMTKGLKGELEKVEWKRVIEAEEKIRKSNIYIDDSSLNTPVNILSKCRRLAREKGGLDLVVVDYLQLMSSGVKTDNRQTEVSEMSRAMKIAARELNVPIILLSQLSRAIETRQGHWPQLSDLRESGAIEQDADIVMFLHNPEKYNADTVVPDVSIIDLIIAKHRNGALANIKLKFLSEFTSFVDIEKDKNMQSLEDSMPSTNKIENQIPPPENPDDIFE